MIVEIVPELVFHLARGADQGHAHEEEKEALQGDGDQVQPRVARQDAARRAVLEMVDRLPDDPGGPHLEHIGA